LSGGQPGRPPEAEKNRHGGISENSGIAPYFPLFCMNNMVKFTYSQKRGIFHVYFSPPGSV
ncbi:MAG: hypothetical protein RR336_08615, partial [Oscillospiraceae bacterium]